ncbi:hypothetical protein [Peterkaempfera griseoplana]|uniref:hypothetical protein n=1 Tax=Peterkaempfera griseoplana TaxID=66896 RepID=UPI000A73D7F1|nr:hypothetical protein [Peterkaempfera griseoplana]
MSKEQRWLALIGCVVGVAVLHKWSAAQAKALGVPAIAVSAAGIVVGNLLGD